MPSRFLVIAVVTLTLATGCRATEPPPENRASTPTAPSREAIAFPAPVEISPGPNRWTRVPKEFGEAGGMWSVAATGPKDVWVVGTEHAENPVVLRWNGRRWAEVVPRGPKSPRVVSVSPRGDVWVFGEDAQAWRWTGRGWTHVKGPSGRLLEAAVATAPDEFWITGALRDASPDYQAFLMRWKAGKWTDYQPTPGGNKIEGFSALSPNDVWAVGDSAIIHWDGTTWHSLIPGYPGYPEIRGHDVRPGSRQVTFLYDIAAVSPREVWVVGGLVSSTTSGGTESDNSNSDRGEPVVLRWDGRRWTVMDVPRKDHSRDDVYRHDAFTTIAADGRGGFWVAALFGGSERILRYDGGWTDEGAPPGTSWPDEVADLAKVPGSERMIAVGSEPDYEEDSTGWIWMRS
ncbi:hypothetical protein [Rhizohabitans arisaemae]|uniref:hypothetical protein n=1 Tax=Rhizohabitans arisaemae TaxID=2720610 RepID=UPI0024B12FFF|nr:hypothetical protein [Rhizohabitans arisaemae]